MSNLDYLNDIACDDDFDGVEVAEKTQKPTTPQEKNAAKMERDKVAFLRSHGVSNRNYVVKSDVGAVSIHSLNQDDGEDFADDCGEFTPRADIAGKSMHEMPGKWVDDKKSADPRYLKMREDCARREREAEQRHFERTGEKRTCKKIIPVRPAPGDSMSTVQREEYLARCSKLAAVQSDKKLKNFLEKLATGKINKMDLSRWFNKIVAIRDSGAFEGVAL